MKRQELLREMIESYGDRVFRLALRYTGDHHRAEDIVQETFLRAFRHLGGFDESRPAGPWLFRITVNLCRNAARGNREIPAEIPDSASGPDPEHLCIQQEHRRELLQALESLPEMYREVVLLKHVSELSYTEISAVLGWELSLVKNRLYRGRLMLREALEHGREKDHAQMPR